MTTDKKPDTLTQDIGVLTRREVEARILAPVIDALGKRFGRDEVVEVVRDTIVELSRQQGAELSEAMGGKGCSAFQQSLQYWTKDDALHIEVKEQRNVSRAGHPGVGRCVFLQSRLCIDRGV